MPLLIFNSNDANNALRSCGLSKELKETEFFFSEIIWPVGEVGGEKEGEGEGIGKPEPRSNDWGQGHRAVEVELRLRLGSLIGALPPTSLGQLGLPRTPDIRLGRELL